MQFGSNDIVLYPTDTVYGLGVDATNPEMVQKLKELKGRGDEKHISIAVSDVAMLHQYAEVTPLSERLAKHFLPGKLTLVLNVQNPGFAHFKQLSNDGTVGVRIPNHPQALELIQELGKPITATSANVFGMPTERTVEKILTQFGGKAKMITKVIDAGELPLFEPSTVVDARGKVPVIIRHGAILQEKIMAVGQP